MPSQNHNDGSEPFEESFWLLIPITWSAIAFLSWIFNGTISDLKVATIYNLVVSLSFLAPVPLSNSIIESHYKNTGDDELREALNKQARLTKFLSWGMAILGLLVTIAIYEGGVPRVLLNT